MKDQGQRAYTYFPGCSLMATNRAYDVSTRSAARTLDLKLVELEDWNCCGATAYMAIDENAALVLAARNLALAEKERRDLVTGCNACYLDLKKTNKYFAESPETRAVIEKGLAAGGMSYRGTVRVRHFLEVVVNDVGEERVRRSVARPLEGLKVVPYYGCQITRPFSDIDDAEYPRSLDRLLAWLGAQVVPYSLKTKCCGGMLMTTQPETGRKLVGKLLLPAKKQGSDCLATCCPLCQINLEAYQRQVSRQMGRDCALPVLYFTQLMGVAFGLTPKELALADSLTPVEATLTEKVR